MKLVKPFMLLPFLFALSLWSASPVPYTGKIDIQGVNYFGEAHFAFSLHDGNGTTHWRNGNQPGETIKVSIRNGRYNVLLGGQGMNSLPPELFLNHDKLFLKVEFDDGDGTGLRHLAPDQLITATPRALVAEISKLSEGVSPGAITRDMLNSEVLTKLDMQAEVADGSVTASKIASKTIGKDQISDDILKYLKPEITAQPQAQTIYADSNASFSVTAEGKYLTYQWKKGGTNLTGETNATFIITDANATQHDDNYSVVVSNDFGSVESGLVEVLVSNWGPNSIPGLELWLDANDVSTFELLSNSVSQWSDKSSKKNHFIQSDLNKRPEFSGGVLSFSAGNQLAASQPIQFSVLNMIYVKKSSDEKSSDFSAQSDKYGTTFENGSGVTSKNFGSPDYYLNGHPISLATRLDAYQYIHDGTSKILSVVNCSTISWPVFGIANYGGWEYEGEYSEIIFISGALLDLDRQKIEGYLAHKWGLTADLPSDHPYKNNAP